MDNKEDHKNPLLCDLETGSCEISPDKNQMTTKNIIDHSSPLIKIIYFTDPICSSCWGIEPQLRKLKLEYGDHIEIEYCMGGLLPDWSYNSGGISQPSDVAHHWDEVSLHYDMPIDGDVWLEDPLESSYPPSIAFKAAQLQDDYKAGLFLREIREMVFLKKKNIARWEYLAIAAQKVGLNLHQFKIDFENEAKVLFETDLALKKDLGVRGFPTLFFIDQKGNREILYGVKAYAFYEVALLSINPKLKKKDYLRDHQALFGSYTTLTTKEFEILSGQTRTESERLLKELQTSGYITLLTTKNGLLWLKQ
jgi:predicted DsbA family dithiol-disulfide isomerase